MLALLAAIILFIVALISLLILALFVFLAYIEFTDTGGPFTTYYKNARCENTVFATDEETILLDNLNLWSLGVISTMSLKSSQRYALDRGSPPHRQQETRIYPAGSRVKTLGFYKTGNSRAFGGYQSSCYYLQSLEDNRTFWLPISEYDVQRCRADFRWEADRGYYPKGADIENQHRHHRQTSEKAVLRTATA